MSKTNTTTSSTKKRSKPSIQKRSKPSIQKRIKPSIQKRNKPNTRVISMNMTITFGPPNPAALALQENAIQSNLERWVTAF